jgi:ribosome-associated heat shock protein Hsp15
MSKPGVAAPASETSQRLDKWLWYARIAKSRTLAATAVTDGKFKVNRVTADKASQTVKVGDVITSRLRRDIRVLRVAALGARRGPAEEAQKLYEDLTPPPPPKAEVAASAWGERAPGQGRPTKRERRQIDEFKGKS